MIELRIRPDEVAARAGTPFIESVSLGLTTITSLAWPILFAVFLWLLYKRKLSWITDRIDEIAFPWGGHVRMREAFKKANVTQEIVQTETFVNKQVFHPPSVTLDDPFVRLAELSPMAAIVQSYAEVEKELVEVSKKMYAGGLKMPPSALIRKLGVDDKHTVELLNRIRKIRNEAVHSVRSLTTGEALEFKRLCDTLITALKARFDDMAVIQVTPEKIGD